MEKESGNQEAIIERKNSNLLFQNENLLANIYLVSKHIYAYFLETVNILHLACKEYL